MELCFNPVLEWR